MRISDLAVELDMDPLELMCFLLEARIPTNGDSPYTAKLEEHLVQDVRDRVTQSKVKIVVDHIHEKHGEPDGEDTDEEDDDLYDAISGLSKLFP